jgi:hypothetical protein
MATFPKFDMPTFDIPTFEMPKFEMPTFDMPTFDMPTPETVLGAMRDAAYAGTGMVAVTAEKLVELQSQVLEVLKEQLARVRS